MATTENQIELRNQVRKHLQKVGYAYNADFDIIPDGPRVTWGEIELMQACTLLLDNVAYLTGEIILMQANIANLQAKIDYHNL